MACPNRLPTSLPACLPACRESLLKLEVVREGQLNAVVFWFDLHLDDVDTLTNGEWGGGASAGGGWLTAGTARWGAPLLFKMQRPSGESGFVLMVLGHLPGAAPDGIGEEGVLLDEDGNPAGAGEGAGSPADAAPPASPLAAPMPGAGDEAAAAPAAAPRSEEQEPEQEAPGPDFVPAESFDGPRQGYAFKLGDSGLGYYSDGNAADVAPAAAADGDGDAAGGLPAAPTDADAAPAPPLGPGPRHHWGQALQYLDRSVGVLPGRRVALLARREDGRLRFALRQGVGQHVERPPWKEAWGGGASVENPHVQRVHYCELLVGAAPATPVYCSPNPNRCSGHS